MLQLDVHRLGENVIAVGFVLVIALLCLLCLVTSSEAATVTVKRQTAKSASRGAQQHDRDKYYSTQ